MSVSSRSTFQYAYVLRLRSTEHLFFKISPDLSGIVYQIALGAITPYSQQAAQPLLHVTLSTG